MEKQITEASKFLSFVLRHQPEAIGLMLDAEGWANVDELIDRAARDGRVLTYELIATVVKTSDKKRFTLSEDGQYIRAAQGHSTPQVAIRYAEKMPPEFLYHGTASRFLESINTQGLVPGSRHYVHLSADVETARAVGRRHGKPVVITVKAMEMYQRGITFYQAENGVWLVAEVGRAFLVRCKMV
ncbi:RNA 2'-phosphotransferase [Superficieibacter electus]|uniref:Probable RNA 2'-phosphotransferase n=1 Tax=Superficieibacter electus TaxID=2022662 RepID=A0A2P5GQW5_9ENTR|nr:RNA 2'-phosphotransferase [Superficieibacter electus]POP43425.1 RNA 2'-phosphotransferase [Superficieibacter electus]POP48940.1 RNA 2'-phosphotransferase [Superficieibacter electus]